MEDGVWYLNGKKQQLDITEVSRNNASHGLLRNASYELVDESEFSVTLEAAVFPQHGYPFLLRHRVRYELAADLGLVVRQLLINDSQEPAPFVLGAHPYLRLGELPSEELTVTVRAGTRLVTDQRLIPRGTEPVGGDFDLRAGRPVGELDLDSAYTDLEFDAGIARHTLSAAGRAQREPLAGRELRLRPCLCHHGVPGQDQGRGDRAHDRPGQRLQQRRRPPLAGSGGAVRHDVGDQRVPRTLSWGHSFPSEFPIRVSHPGSAGESWGYDAS